MNDQASTGIKVSIIIVTYKSYDVIKECLDSIYRFNDISDSLEIIIVDNSPLGDPLEMFVSNEYPNVRFIKNEKNNGFGAANNLGAVAASGRYLLFLNPDTVLIEPILSYLVTEFDHDPSIGVAGFICRRRDGSVTKSFGVLPEKKIFLPAMFYYPLIKYLHYTPQNLFPWGADLVIRKDIFERAGMFDENIFMCYEEPDIMHRIGNQFRIKIFNRSIIHLDGHTTQPNKLQQRISIALVSEKYYFNKYGMKYTRYVKKSILSLTAKKIIKTVFHLQHNPEDEILLKHYKTLL